MTPIIELEPIRLYLMRIEATPVSIRSAVIRIQRGQYYEDQARITFLTDGSVRAPDDLAPTESEAKAIAEAIKNASIPEQVPAPSLKKLPFNPKSRELFIFRDDDKRIIMIQERIIDEKSGDKKYIPWTFWSDGEWRRLEPEDSLPLFNAESLNDSNTVFIHEGPKSVRNLLLKLEKGDHPWQVELENAAHVGWIGGALNPYRTNWKALAKAGITRAYIVADNDNAGVSAIRHIAKKLNCITYSIQFDQYFPVGFDLGDEFPKDMFTHNLYKGKPFFALLHPSTWMTEQVPKVEGEKGRTAYRLRKNAEDVWIYCEGSDQYVLGEKPDIIRSEQVLNRMLMSYSKVSNTCQLICKSQTSRMVNLAYRPDKDKIMINVDDMSAINTHIGCLIPPIKGDLTLFNEFLTKLLPNKDEKKDVEKWIATIIARPEIRIGFALLMISEKQGIGKTTLGNHILAPLVGFRNTSFPRESDILSDYNEWVAHKRLSIANEIYLGSGWKAYQVLQSTITDSKLTVNKKHIRQYEIDNWCHIYACSNSIRALKIRREDRRWFVPTIGEKKETKKYWDTFYGWLNKGGLSNIRQWAMDYGDYYTTGEHAPTSIRKKEMIEDSESEAWKEARVIGGLIADFGKPVSVPMRDIMSFLRSRVRREIHESNAEIRRAMEAEGALILPGRTKIDGANQYIVGNTLIIDELSNIKGPVKEKQTFIRGCRVNVNDLVTEPM